MTGTQIIGDGQPVIVEAKTFNVSNKPFSSQIELRKTEKPLTLGNHQLIAEAKRLMACLSNVIRPSLEVP